MSDVRWLDDDEQAAWRGMLVMQAKLQARLSRAMQRDAGLSDADYGVLVELTEAPEGKLRIFQLGRFLQWEKSRLSHHLRRMEARGLVAREECETDRRGAYVVVTKKGRVAIERAAPKHVAEVRQAFMDALDPAQLEQLRRITGDVLANLDRLEADAPCPE
jgi:DNA-binding MarR family transcriptional regulator